MEVVVRPLLDGSAMIAFCDLSPARVQTWTTLTGTEEVSDLRDNSCLLSEFDVNRTRKVEGR